MATCLKTYSQALGSIDCPPLPAHGPQRHGDTAGALLVNLTLGLTIFAGLFGWQRRTPAARRVTGNGLFFALVTDAGAGTDAAVRESGLSRATVCRLLGPKGGLATLIRHCRPEELRRRLDDPDRNRTIADLAKAAGFAGIGHASRAFLERYAVRPGEHRDIVTAGTGTDALFKMRFWQEEVR